MNGQNWESIVRNPVGPRNAIDRNVKDNEADR